MATSPFDASHMNPHEEEDDDHLDLMLQQAARLAAQMRSTVEESNKQRQSQSQPRQERPDETKKVEEQDETKKLEEEAPPPPESPLVAEPTSSGLPSAISISEQDHSDVISAVTYPAELTSGGKKSRSSKKKKASNTKAKKARPKDTTSPATVQQQEVEAAIRASEEMAQALQVLNAPGIDKPAAGQSPVTILAAQTKKVIKDQAGSTDPGVRTSGNSDGAIVSPLIDAEYVPIKDYVAKATTNQGDVEKTTPTEETKSDGNPPVLAQSSTSTSELDQTTPSWKLYSAGADQATDDAAIKDSTAQTKPATQASEKPHVSVKEAAHESPGELRMPTVASKGEYPGSAWRFDSSGGGPKKENDLTRQSTMKAATSHDARKDDTTQMVAVAPSQQDVIDSNAPNWVRLSKLPSPSLEKGPRVDDKPTPPRITETTEQQANDSSGTKPKWLQMATLTDTSGGFPPLEKPVGTTGAPQTPKRPVDLSMEKENAKEEQPKEVAQVETKNVVTTPPRPVTSPPRSTTWEKVDVAKESDDDYVAIRDYSTAPFPVEREPKGDMKWTKMEDAKAGDIDFVPLRGVGVGDTPISRKERLILKNVTASKSQEGVKDGFGMMGADKLRTPANVKWERVDYAEENDDDYVPLRDYSNQKSRSSKDKKSKIRNSTPTPTSPPSIEHTIQAAYKTRDYSIDAIYKMEQEEDERANRMTYAFIGVVALILVLMGLYNSESLFPRAEVSQPHGLYQRSRKPHMPSRSQARQASYGPDKSKEAEEVIRFRQQQKLEEQRRKEAQKRKKEQQRAEKKGQASNRREEGSCTGQECMHEDHSEADNAFCNSPLGFISKRCGRQLPGFPLGGTDVSWKKVREDPNQIIDSMYQ